MNLNKFWNIISSQFFKNDTKYDENSAQKYELLMVQEPT